MGSKALLAALALGLIVSSGNAGTARQYRGPEGDAPIGVRGPTQDGLLGTDRLVSRSRQVEGLSRWEFWWEANRDEFLRSAATRNGSVQLDDSLQSFTARHRPDRDVDPGDVKTRVVPAVMRMLRSGDVEARSLAALALGKARVVAAFGPLREMLKKGTPADRRAAALALGFLNEPLATPVLVDLMTKSGVSPYERAYAALALGLSGDPEASAPLRSALKQAMKHRGSAVEEYQAAAATALGLLEDRKSMPLLLVIARNHENRTDVVRAAAINALGRIGDGASVPLLLKTLEDSQVEVRRASAQSLGMLGESQAKSALSRALDRDGDVTVRAYAAVALARIGGTDVGPMLVSSLGGKSPRALRGFSALALGLLGDRAHAPRLRALLDAKSESSTASAAAIALGLLGDPVSRPRLREIAADRTANGGLRGYAILSLAMQGDPVMRHRILGHARETGSAEVRRSATLGLGLYGELSASRAILGSLFEEQDAWVKGAAISALTLKPRTSVVDTLIGVLESKSFSNDARKDAITALGVLARTGDAASHRTLLTELNYRSSSAAVKAVSDLF